MRYLVAGSVVVFTLGALDLRRHRRQPAYLRAVQQYGPPPQYGPPAAPPVSEHDYG